MLQRSCWKIPRTVMPIDGDLVIYDESAQYVYAMAATWDRPDVAAAGGTRESLAQPTRRARFVRTTVRQPAADPADPDAIVRVKASAVRQSDVVVDADVPFVLFAGDEADDVVGQKAMQEAAQRIAAESP